MGKQTISQGNVGSFSLLKRFEHATIMLLLVVIRIGKIPAQTLVPSHP